MQDREPMVRHQSQSYKEVFPICDHNRLFTSLLEKAGESQFKMPIASTITHDSDYIWYDDEYEYYNPEGSESENTGSERTEEFEDINQIPKQIIKENGPSEDIDLDEALISAAHERPRHNITAEHLSKIWRINLDTTKITLDSTPQRNTTHPDSNSTRRFTTNDRMLRYKRIKEHFFMDTLFATRKMTKYLKGNRCCQLFVTDKGFVLHCADEVKE